MREPAVPQGATRGLAYAGTRGAAWQGLSYLVGKAMVLLTTVILARLLTPEDFGLVGLALVFVTYVEVATDLGVAQALVVLPAGRRRNDTALLISVGSSALLVAAAMMAAPAVARFFGRPEVAGMLRVLALSLLLTAMAQVPDALLRRSLRFRSRVVTLVGRALAQGAVSVGLALSGAGPWAIVGGYLAGTAAYAVLSWILAGYRPGTGFWRVDRGEARALLAFGAPAAANGVVLSLVFDVDYLFVGKVLGAAALGHYTLAYRLPELAIINVFFILSVVAFPLFARAREDRTRLRRGYLTAVRLQSVYGLGAGVGLAVVAPMVVHVLFGAGWEPAVAPMQALALYAAFRSLGIGPVDLLKAEGRPGLAFWLSLVRLAAVVGALALAVRSGIAAVAWAQAAVALALALLMQGVAFRVLGIGLRRLLPTVWPAVACAAGVAAGAGTVRLLGPGPEVLRVLLALGAGAACGLGALHLADRGFVRQVRALVSGPVGSPEPEAVRTAEPVAAP